MRRPSKLLLAACAAAALAACTDPSKIPAEAALKAADAAFEAVKADARRLVPAQTEALSTHTADAPAPSAGQTDKAAVAAAAAAKKDELTKVFEGATAEL